MTESWQEYVPHPMGGKVLVELEQKPNQMMVATENSVGINVEELLQRLGFVFLDERRGKMVLTTTPERILDKEWAVSYPDKEKDPDLLTIYLDHGPEVGHLELLRQIKNPREEGEYLLFFAS